MIERSEGFSRFGTAPPTRMTELESAGPTIDFGSVSVHR